MVRRARHASRIRNTAVKRRAQTLFNDQRAIGGAGQRPHSHGMRTEAISCQLRDGAANGRRRPLLPTSNQTRAAPRAGRTARTGQAAATAACRPQRRPRRTGALPPHRRDRRRPHRPRRPLRHRGTHPARADGLADASAGARRAPRRPGHRPVATAVAHLAARARPAQHRPGQAARRRSPLRRSGVDRLGHLGPGEGVVSRLHPPRPGHALRDPRAVRQGAPARGVLVAQVAQRGGADQLPAGPTRSRCASSSTPAATACGKAGRTCSRTCRPAMCA
jgi:hypothetical protein